MTTAWIAKNRTTLIVTVVVLVAAYVFYYAKNGIAPSMCMTFSASSSASG